MNEITMKKGFPIDNNIPYRQVEWLSLSKLADFMGEFTKDGNDNSQVWDFFWWLDKKSRFIKSNK
jgi:hypothetical protein